MGNSLDSLDMSKYVNSVNNMVQSSVAPTFLGNNTAGSYVDTVDFSGFSTNTSSNNSWYGSTTDNSLDTNSNSVVGGGLEEVDDFSGGQYGEYVLQQYFLQYGDVNGDGQITSVDAILVQNYLTSNRNDNNIFPSVDSPDHTFDFNNKIIDSRIERGMGDIDGDGKVTINDVTLIQKYLTEGTIEPTNITMANRLDTIKYTNLQTQIDNDLGNKKQGFDNIEYYKSLMFVINGIAVDSNTDNNMVPSDFRGNAEDYGLFKNGGISYDYYNRGGGIYNDPFYGYGDVESNEFDSTLGEKYGNKLDSLDLPKVYTKEEYKQAMVKKFVSAMQYIKTHNSLKVADQFDVQSRSCDEAIKYADEIVGYMLEYGSLDKAYTAYQNNIASLQYSKRQANKQIALIPYDNIMKTADFKKFANNTKIETLDPEKNDKLKNCSKYMDYYKYLDISQLTMFNYLLETQGEDAANKYFEIYEDDVNKAKGFESAKKYIGMMDKNFSMIVNDDGSLMDETDIAAAQALVNNISYDKKYDMNNDGVLDEEDITKLSQYIELGGEILVTFDNLNIAYAGGLWDGFINFFESFKYIDADTAVMSADEYKMMYIAQCLSDNGLSLMYEYGQTVGNMGPTIIAAAAASAATAYLGGEGGIVVLGTTLSAAEAAEAASEITAGSLIFMSTYGKSKHEALVKGHDLETAVGYGFLSGLSEAGLETLLGSLPYVGKECSNVFTSMFKEGFTEAIQEYVGTMIGHYVLGEEIDVTNLSADMGKAFIFGALLSGKSSVVNTSIKVSINGLRYELSQSQIMDYYNKSIDPVTGENNGLTLQEYVKENVKPSGESSITVTSAPVIVSALEAKITSINTEIDAEIDKLDPSSLYYDQQCALLENKRTKMIELAVLMNNTTVDVSNPMSGLTDSQRAEVTGYVNFIHDVAVAHEPGITADMKALEDSSTYLVGLDNKVKSVGALEAQLAGKMAKGDSLLSASTYVKDSLSYTLIVDESSYESTVKAKLADLVRKGYIIESWRDTWSWGGAENQGLSVNLRKPDGALVELQFHTEDSFKIKNLNCEYYEIAENPAMNNNIVEICNEIQRINQRLYVRNVGFNFDLLNVVEIGQMANGTEKIMFTNVSAKPVFKTQIDEYKKNHPGCELVPGTDVPKAMVVSDINYIYQMGNGDLSAGLQAISKKYGEYSVQAVSARTVAFQYALEQVQFQRPSDFFVDLAKYFSQLFEYAELDGVDNTIEIKNAGLDPKSASDCNDWLSQKYKSDILAWGKISNNPGGLDGLHYFTGNGYTTIGPQMRSENGYKSTISLDALKTIVQLSEQLDSSSAYGLKGLGERTIIYRGIDNPDWIPGIQSNMWPYQVEMVINSLATGTVVMGDNCFQSSTPVFSQGFTNLYNENGVLTTPVIEVCSCPPGTEGAYLGEYSSHGYSEVEYLLQAGSGNRKVILGAKQIYGRVFIFTEMIPESEVVSSTSAIADVEIDSSVQSFNSETDLQAYIRNLYSGANPDTSLATKTVLKYIQDRAASSSMSGALYYEFLSMYDTGLDSSQNAELLTDVINSSSDLRQAIYDGALEEMKSTFGKRFGFSDAKCQELLNTLLGEDFVKHGVGAGINWEQFRTDMRSAIRTEVQDGIRSGKEAVIWSGFDDQYHDTMDSKYTTISNTSIGGLTFLEAVYMNWDSEATPQKASILWGIMSEEYAEACCLATDENGNKLNSIKFLYPCDTTSTGADLLGNLFKSSEFPQILESGTIDTIVMTKTNPDDMSVVSTVEIDIKDIRDYYLKYKDIPGAKSIVSNKCFDMLSARVKEAMS